MMNRVVQPHHQESDRGALEHPAKVNDLHELLAGQLSERIKILCVTLLIS